MSRGTEYVNYNKDRSPGLLISYLEVCTLRPTHLWRARKGQVEKEATEKFPKENSSFRGCWGPLQQVGAHPCSSRWAPHRMGSGKHVVPKDNSCRNTAVMEPQMAVPLAAAPPAQTVALLGRRQRGNEQGCAPSWEVKSRGAGFTQWEDPLFCGGFALASNPQPPIGAVPHRPGASVPLTQATPPGSLLTRQMIDPSFFRAAAAKKAVWHFCYFCSPGFWKIQGRRKVER